MAIHHQINAYFANIGSFAWFTTLGESETLQESKVSQSNSAENNSVFFPIFCLPILNKKSRSVLVRVAQFNFTTPLGLCKVLLKIKTPLTFRIESLRSYVYGPFWVKISFKKNPPRVGREYYIQKSDRSRQYHSKFRIHQNSYELLLILTPFGK